MFDEEIKGIGSVGVPAEKRLALHRVNREGTEPVGLRGRSLGNIEMQVVTHSGSSKDGDPLSSAVRGGRGGGPRPLPPAFFPGCSHRLSPAHHSCHTLSDREVVRGATHRPGAQRQPCLGRGPVCDLPSVLRCARACGRMLGTWVPVSCVQQLLKGRLCVSLPRARHLRKRPEGLREAGAGRV